MLNKIEYRYSIDGEYKWHFRELVFAKCEMCGKYLASEYEDQDLPAPKCFYGHYYCNDCIEKHNHWNNGLKPYIGEDDGHVGNCPVCNFEIPSDDLILEYIMYMHGTNKEAILEDMQSMFSSEVDEDDGYIRIKKSALEKFTQYATSGKWK
jgi:hypothetical protein